MQVRREHIVRTQERLAKEKEEKTREEQRKQVLLESMQRDSDYLEELKRARGKPGTKKRRLQSPARRPTQCQDTFYKPDFSASCFLVKVKL